MNYYKRHLGDYAKDAGHLSMLEHGAYTMLLDRYYTGEGPIGKEEVYRVTRARSRAEKSALSFVLDKFFTFHDGAYHNHRADEELARYASRRELNRQLGRKGGRPKGSPNESDSVSETDNESVSKNNPSHKPVAISHKEQDQERPPAAAKTPSDEDPIKGLIDGGIAYLGTCGVSEKQARTVIGMLRRDLGSDLETAELLTTAERECVAEPVAWLRRAAMKRMAKSATPAYVPLPGEI